MKKYKVEGRNPLDLVKKVAIKLAVKESEVRYNILTEDRVNNKVIMEVWVEKEEVIQKKDDESASTEEDNSLPYPESMVKVEITAEGVFLMVKSGQVEMNDVINIIAARDIHEPDIEMVSEAYSSRDKRIKIADFYEGIYREAGVEIELTEDKMQAFVIITEPKGMAPPTVQYVVQKIKEKGVNLGIDEEVIKMALNAKKFGQKILIAEGLMSQDGKDGYIKYLIKSIEQKGKLKPSIDESGKVDFKTLDIIENVKIGQILAEKIMPESGIEGKNVLGEVSPAKPGKEILLSPGKNTVLNAEGTVLTAAIDGMVNFQEKKINVLNVFTTQDVGNTTGNINFLGSVLVKGDVHYGFSIEAEGNIEVGGNVEKALLKANGDVMVRGGFFGKEKGEIMSKNDVILNFAESVIIECEGNVIVNEALMNSRILCGKKLSVLDRKGTIVGGDIIAGEGVEAINIGSHLESKTNIEVGANPHLVEKIKELETEIEETEKKMEQVEKNITLLQKLRAAMKENMPKDKEELLTQLLKAKFTMTKFIHDSKEEIEEINSQISDVKKATVDVHGICYPGVKIKIRKGTYFVKEKIQNVRFYYEGGDVKITALK